MSLDVYLSVPGAANRREGTGIFIRENGATREITRTEWDERFPGREPVTMADSEESNEVYSANITHNLGRMAAEAGIYEALWRPGELLDPDKAARIREQEKAHNYHGAGGVFEIERSLPAVHGRDLIQPLRDGLEKLRARPEHFEQFNPENGWGDYDGLVQFTERYLAACEEYPDADVRVSR